MRVGFGPGAAVSSHAADDRSEVVSETDIKASFLVKLPMFVTWPATPGRDREDPIVIGILGEDPFGETFDATIKPLRFEGRPFAIRRFPDVAALGDCQILFVGRSVQKQWPEVFRKLAGKPVLTISDASGFAVQGGMFNFVAEGSRVRFECNREAVQRAGLKVSGRLLQISRLVREERPPAP